MWEDILSTVGCSVPWGIWVPWGLSWVSWGDIMMHIFITGGEKSFAIWVLPWYWTPSMVLMITPTVIMIQITKDGYPPTVIMIQITKDGYPPTVLNTLPPRYSWYPHVHHDSPTYIMIPPMVLSIPHGTQDNPTVLKVTPMVLKVTPMVLKITPTVLKITPIVLMISPHGTEHPPRYSRYPHIYHDIPHRTEHHHGT